MNQKTIISVVIVVILVGAIAYFVATKNTITSKPAPQKSVSQSENNNVAPAQTTEVVSCGKNYTADVVMIGGVDVVKRIVEQRSRGKCELSIAGNNIAVAQKADAEQKVYTVVLYDKNDKEQSADPFNQSVEIYQIDLNKNELSFQSQFDGSFNKFGSWK